MRLESTGAEGQYKVWLTDTELDTLARQGGARERLIIKLGGYVGLRAFEIPQVTPSHVKRTDDGEHYRLRVPQAKDTTGSGGKKRDAYLPDHVESDIHTYANDRNLAPDEPLIQVSTRRVRDIVKEAADSAAETAGEPDFQYVSSHDLRRRFAQRLLVDKQMNPRVVMSVGGWDSFAAIEPYLNTPTEGVINEAFTEAGI